MIDDPIRVGFGMNQTQKDEVHQIAAQVAEAFKTNHRVAVPQGGFVFNAHVVTVTRILAQQYNIKVSDELKDGVVYLTQLNPSPIQSVVVQTHTFMSWLRSLWY